MRVRALDANGDMVFGAGAATFLIDSPQAVVQCVLTALKLFQGEWFLDTTAGVPWNTQVLGINPQSSYDNAIKNAIHAATGVSALTAYSSSLDKATRVLTVTASGTSPYGDWTLSTSVPFASPVSAGFGVGGFGQTLAPGS